MNTVVVVVVVVVIIMAVVVVVVVVVVGANQVLYWQNKGPGVGHPVAPRQPPAQEAASSKCMGG